LAVFSISSKLHWATGNVLKVMT